MFVCWEFRWSLSSGILLQVNRKFYCCVIFKFAHLAFRSTINKTRNKMCCQQVSDQKILIIFCFPSFSENKKYVHAEHMPQLCPISFSNGGKGKNQLILTVFLELGFGHILTPEWPKLGDRRLCSPVLNRGSNSPALLPGALSEQWGAHARRPPVLQVEFSLCTWGWVAEGVRPSPELRGVWVLLWERVPRWRQGGGWRSPWRRVPWRVVLKSKHKWGLSFSRGSGQTCGNPGLATTGHLSSSGVRTNHFVSCTQPCRGSWVPP